MRYCQRPLFSTNTTSATEGDFESPETSEPKFDDSGFALDEFVDEITDTDEVSI